MWFSNFFFAETIVESFTISNLGKAPLSVSNIERIEDSEKIKGNKWYTVFPTNFDVAPGYTAMLKKNDNNKMFILETCHVDLNNKIIITKKIFKLVWLVEK